AQFLADRGIVLDGGRIVAEGSSLEALRAYEKLIFHDSPYVGARHADQLGAVGARHAAPGVMQHPNDSAPLSILNAAIYGADGHPAAEIEMGSPFGIEVECNFQRSVDLPLF